MSWLKGDVAELPQTVNLSYSTGGSHNIWLNRVCDTITGFHPKSLHHDPDALGGVRVLENEVLECLG